MSGLPERVAILENQMEMQAGINKDLRESVDALNAVLNKGRGALWLFLALVAGAASVAANFDRIINSIRGH